MFDDFININNTCYYVLFNRHETWADASFSHQFGVEHRQELDKVDIEVKEVWAWDEQIEPSEALEKEIKDVLCNK